MNTAAPYSAAEKTIGRIRSMPMHTPQPFGLGNGLRLTGRLRAVLNVTPFRFSQSRTAKSICTMSLHDAGTGATW